jgi:uncharacterized protein YegL
MSKFQKNWINLCFIIDSSGSMWSSKEDVIGGFKKIIKEQKEVEEGKVTVSLFTFNSEVTEHYVGKDINDIPKFKYECEGMTRLNDGIGTAVDKVGKWLYELDCKGEEMPQKTIVVVMTDGLENSSTEYTLDQIRAKIKEQTDVYSWEFVYQGVDITTTNAADNLGFKYKTYNTRSKLSNNYDMINTLSTTYRKFASTAGATVASINSVVDTVLLSETAKNTADFEKALGKKITSV